MPGERHSRWAAVRPTSARPRSANVAFQMDIYLVGNAVMVIVAYAQALSSDGVTAAFSARVTAFGVLLQCNAGIAVGKPPGRICRIRRASPAEFDEVEQSYCH